MKPSVTISLPVTRDPRFSGNLHRAITSTYQWRTEMVERHLYSLKKLSELDLRTDVEEYVAKLVNVSAVVNVQQCSLLHGYATFSY